MTRIASDVPAAFLLKNPQIISIFVPEQAERRRTQSGLRGKKVRK